MLFSCHARLLRGWRGSRELTPLAGATGTPLPASRDEVEPAAHLRLGVVVRTRGQHLSARRGHDRSHLRPGPPPHPDGGAAPPPPPRPPARGGGGGGLPARRGGPRAARPRAAPRTAAAAGGRGGGGAA